MCIEFAHVVLLKQMDNKYCTYVHVTLLDINFGTEFCIYVVRCPRDARGLSLCSCVEICVIYTVLC